MKKIIAILLMTVVTISLAACGNDEFGSQYDNDQILVSVGDTEVLMEEFKERVVFEREQTEEGYKQYYEGKEIDWESEEGKEINKQIQDHVINQIINQILFEKAIEEYEITVSQEKVLEAYNEVAEENGGEEAFETLLLENNYTKEEYKEEIRKELLTENFIEFVLKDIEVSEEEIQKEYDDYEARFLEAVEEDDDLDIEDLQTFDELQETIERAIREDKGEEVFEAFWDSFTEKHQIVMNEEISLPIS